MHAAFWDQSADDIEDREYPDVPEDETGQTVVCPECGGDVYEDADQCPACGMFLIHETNAWAGKSTWWIVLGLLGVVAVVLALTLGR